MTEVLAVRARADALLARHPLRAADAGQLGAALLAREEPADALTFVCLDRRLSLAAEREGLRVATPAHPHVMPVQVKDANAGLPVGQIPADDVAEPALQPFEREIVWREFNVTSGNVSALAGLGDDAKRLQITAPVQRGNSGGPLLDGAGNVIGVVVSKLDAVRAAKLTGDIPQNVNFAIKGALVRGFLDIHGVAYRRRPSDAKLAPERLAELARGFTVAVHCWK